MKVISDDGEQEDMTVPSSALEAKAPKDGADVERISSGTRFALLQWLKKRKERSLWGTKIGTGSRIYTSTQCPKDLSLQKICSV